MSSSLILQLDVYILFVCFTFCTNIVLVSLEGSIGTNLNLTKEENRSGLSPIDYYESLDTNNSSGNFSALLSKEHSRKLSALNGTKQLITTILPPAFTAEDEDIRREWGGNCTAKHWKRCSKLKTWFGDYVDKSNPIKKENKHDIDCKLQAVLCMKNGWTVGRCQILCMGKCNRALVSRYDDYVQKEGQC